MKKIPTHWSIPDDEGNIDVPDELLPLFDKISMQLRFHTISGKNEISTVADILYSAQVFFTKKEENYGGF